MAEDQALGRSRGGPSTKIHLAVRGLGCPVRFHLTAGHRGDAPQALPLIDGSPAQVVMADTAYDSDQIRNAVAQKGVLAVQACFPLLISAAEMPRFPPMTWSNWPSNRCPMRALRAHGGLSIERRLRGGEAERLPARRAGW